jgi:hypothetical protein
MKSSYSQLMQTQYFHPAFNSAIYDGPIRIYFAQFHESMALKIYFLCQQKLTPLLLEAKEVSKRTGATCLLLLYPSLEFFDQTFAGALSPMEKVAVENFEQDLLIGLRGPLEDEELEKLLEILQNEIHGWIQEHKSKNAPQFEGELR